MNHDIDGMAIFKTESAAPLPKDWGHQDRMLKTISFLMKLSPLWMDLKERVDLKNWKLMDARRKLEAAKRTAENAEAEIVSVYLWDESMGGHSIDRHGCVNFIGAH